MKGLWIRQKLSHDLTKHKRSQKMKDMLASLADRCALKPLDDDESTDLLSSDEEDEPTLI